MDSISPKKILSLVLILTGAAFLTVGLITRQPALWGVAPGMITLGVVFLALTRTRRA